MNEIQIFTNPQFGQVRTAGNPNEPWFCAADICQALGYANGRKAVADHVDTPDVTKRDIGVQTGTKSDGTPAYQTMSVSFVNESGLYALIFGSKLPNAKAFKRWVTSEVLPTIRKTGGYGVPQSFSEALMLAAKQQMQIEDMQKNIEARKAEEQRLLIENAQKDETINEQGEQIIKLSNDIVKMQPKVDYCDKILSSTSLVTTTQIAQDYGYSAVAFNKILAELRIQHKVNKQWILYAPYLACGYVDSVPVDINKSDGTVKVVFHTEWTQKGRLFLYEKLKSHNIVPLIEK